MHTEKMRHGFSVLRESRVDELDAVLYHMRHKRTGLELVWLKREEENKTFGIAFQTIPEEDTGVFHILEHSVLCGSERYPVKGDRKSTRLNSSHKHRSRMPSSA